ncbi:ClpXP protease specificity-enhancing factor [Marinospirillum alkaliphilum]|uniref:Stringent starvation protein B n=1 Tax=Marinospirillum alkaliphilum DSM 21637 TaxID=1122209 RepID=A0A1K1TRU3_9GAMM|nr:ClpXP protease specificity-enhancing factor [Marinospirillum alkaliphilum]SFX02763.1 stringent starvation protein B [Marinospirillum alkaliphilum DSM 21637]
MTASSRPYLLRALYEWLLDNQLTPYVIVAADMDGVVVPRAHVQDGQLVLNISPDATRDLLIDDQALAFSARFGGVPMQLYIPVDAVLAIYARENGAGMVFGQEPRLVESQVAAAVTADAGSETSAEDSTVEAAGQAARSRTVSHLKVVK